MVRVCIGLGLFACVVAMIHDAHACHRRRCRSSSSCPTTSVCEGATMGGTVVEGGGGVVVKEGTVKKSTDTGTKTVTGGVSAEEMRWWDSMVKKEYVTKDQFDELWKNSTPAERKKFYDNILKVEKEAAEKAEKELKDKEKLEKPKSKNDKKEDLQSAAPAPATMVVTLPADARLSVQGEAISSASTSRVLVSPNLERGKAFVYTIQAEIVRDGWWMTQSQQVTVRGGETTYVPFRFATNDLARR